MSSRVDETANIDSNMHSRNYFLKKVREGCLIREALLQKLGKVCQKQSVSFLSEWSLHGPIHDTWICLYSFDFFRKRPNFEASRPIDNM